MSKVKTGIFIAGFTAFTLAALYPVAVYPKLHPEVYKEIQRETRKDIKQENIQPGIKKMWFVSREHPLADKFVHPLHLSARQCIGRYEGLVRSILQKMSTAR